MADTAMATGAEASSKMSKEERKLAHEARIAASQEAKKQRMAEKSAEKAARAIEREAEQAKAKEAKEAAKAAARAEREVAMAAKRAEEKVNAEEKASRTAVVSLHTDAFQAHLEGLCTQFGGELEKCDLPFSLKGEVEVNVLFTSKAAADKFKSKKGLAPATLKLSSRPKAVSAKCAFFRLPASLLIERTKESSAEALAACTAAMAKVQGVTHTVMKYDTFVIEFATEAAQAAFVSNTSFAVAGAVVAIQGGRWKSNGGRRRKMDKMNISTTETGEPAAKKQNTRN